MTTYSQSDAKLDLLNLILQPDDPYPWNPDECESEAYFASLETELEELEGFSDFDLTRSAQTFFAQVDSLWSETTLEKSLFQKFAAQIPEELLHRLAKVAVKTVQDMTTGSLSLAEQLVQCVQEILPQWAEEDLQVLARPFAYVMRGTETEGVESVLATLESVRWSQLSEIEQARASLAIARYALVEITTQNHP